MRPSVWAEIIGGDALGRGQEPALCWWLPEGTSVQHAYRLRTDDGFDTGRVDSHAQSFVRVPVFDCSRRSVMARVKVWTDLGGSEWSAPVGLEAGLLAEADWSARWIGVAEGERPGKGSRPAYWLRTTFDTPPAAAARLYATALGLYEAFLDGRRVGDVELAPGYTQYRARVQYQAYDVTPLLPPGRHVLAVLLADGWYRGQVGLPRAADQYGRDVALRAQLEVRTGSGWQVVAGSDPGWRVAPSHITAADLIGGQREDHRRLHQDVHDTAFDDRSWHAAVPREADVAIVGSVSPPVRRIGELRPTAVRPARGGSAFVVDFGQNFSGWVRLARPGPAGGRVTLSYGEWLDRDGDLTTAHLDVDLPVVPEPLPLGQVDEVVSGGPAVSGDDVFEPRFTTHGFRYVRVEGHPGPLGADDVTGIVVHSDLRRTGWFSCSDDRVNRLHEAVVWSLRSNVCDIPTDCPQRERAGWTGDWQVFAPTAAYLYDVLAFTRKWLRDVMLDQRADGCVANMSPCPPSEGFDGPLGALHGSAGWGDAVVSVPWDLYQAYGDASLLREMWDAMTAWVRFAAAAAAGGRHPDRAAARPDPAGHERYLWDTGFHWGEWLEPGVTVTDFPAFMRADKSEVATAYLHRSAAMVDRVARVLGLPEEQQRPYRAIAQGALEAWRREFVRDDGTLVVATQASHVRALAFGLVPQELRPAVAGRLAELIELAGGHLATGFLSTGYLLPVLADHGYLGLAYDLLRQDTAPSWLTMVDRGATTMWEDWDGVDSGGVPHGSLNHYSKGAVATFLHRYVAGLRPVEPGYRVFEVRPRPGGRITWASSCHVGPFGPIEVTWRATGGSMELDVLVPGGTRATVVMPGTDPHEVGPGRHHWTGPRLPADGALRPHGRVVRLERPGALVDLLAEPGVTRGGVLDLGGVGPLLVHGDDRAGQVGPGHVRTGSELAARAAGGALDVRAAQDDHVEVAHRAQPRRAQVTRLVKRHSELAGDVAPEDGRPVGGGGVQDHRARRTSPLELHLVDHGHVHRERRRVHDRQRQRLPLRGQRASHRQEAGHPGLEDSFVDAERDGRLPPLPAQRQQPVDDGGIGVRPEQPVDEQLEPGGHRPADDRGAYDQPVALDQPFPQPPRVVRLGGLRGAAGQAELVEPDELSFGALFLGGPQCRLQQDLRAAVRLTAPQPEDPAARARRRHLSSSSQWLVNHTLTVRE
jgi:alpha-L-rhamnosidase